MPPKVASAQHSASAQKCDCSAFLQKLTSNDPNKPRPFRDITIFDLSEVELILIYMEYCKHFKDEDANSMYMLKTFMGRLGNLLPPL